MFIIYVLLLILGIILNIVIGVSAIANSHRSRVNGLFTAASIIFVIWAASSLIQQFTLKPPFISLRVPVAASLLFSAVLCHAYAALGGMNALKKAILVFWYALCLALTAAGLVASNDGFGFVRLYGFTLLQAPSLFSLPVLQGAFIPLSILVSLFFLFIRREGADGSVNSYASAAHVTVLSICFVFSLMNGCILPILGRDMVFFYFSPVYFVIWALGAGYSIMDRSTASKEVGSSPQDPAAIVDLRRRFQEAHSLTDREMEVIHFVIRGIPNHETAKELDITERTVKAHLTNIYNKLGIDNKYQLITQVKNIDV
jgi:DNA-binding CsgD family transcriptional regulator